MTLFIPSPSISGFNIGPVTIHFYALCLLAGIAGAWWLGSRRWVARGGRQETFEWAVLWAIPLGIVGARIYHVLTHLADYFGPGINPWSVFFIWEGGIAIYGAVGGGAIAAWLACRARGAKFAALADALAPGIAIGQALGRFGNWFNQELYGWPTDLPWGLQIDPQHRVPGYENFATFHPTFLYEMLWNFLVAGVLLWADKRFTLGRGKVFALYMALYGFGRFFTEAMRTDSSYTMIGPMRQNQFAALLICLAGILLLLWLVKFRPGRETWVEPGLPDVDDSATLPVPASEVVDDSATASGPDDTAEAEADGTAAPDDREVPVVENKPSEN